MEQILKGKKIVVAEDSEPLAIVYKRYLEDEGAEVYIGTDGSHGFNQCLINRPDLIIADISMPKMGGLEMISSLKMVNELQDIPVIVVTASMMKMHMMEAQRLGVKDYIVKPVSYKSIMEKVVKVLDIT